MTQRKIIRRIPINSLLICILIITILFALQRKQNLFFQAQIEKPITLATTQPEPLPSQQNFLLSFPALKEAIPLIYSSSFEDSEIQPLLHKGAVILPLQTSFGKPGNSIITAHSSGLPWFGPYKSAFVQLSSLKNGSEFEVFSESSRYVYRVVGRKIVFPHEVDAFPSGNESTVTLVTCWPIMTDYKRLLIFGELIQDNVL